MQRFELADYYQSDVGYQISQAVVYLKLGAEIVGNPIVYVLKSETR